MFYNSKLREEPFNAPFPNVPLNWFTMPDILHIYVDGGDINNNQDLDSFSYYNFYTDNGEGQLTIPAELKLFKNKIYIFHRYSSANSHPFYISDAGYKQQHQQIYINGHGNINTGIAGSQTFTLYFHSDFSGTLNYYCTSHSVMIGTFTVE